MFEIGFAELFLLGVIALLVVGPDRLPALARTVGVWVGRAQRLVGQVRADIEREVRADELRKAAKEYSPTGMLGDMRKEVEDFTSEVSKPVDLDADKPESAKSTPMTCGPPTRKSGASRRWKCIVERGEFYIVDKGLLVERKVGHRLQALGLGSALLASQVPRLVADSA